MRTRSERRLNDYFAKQRAKQHTKWYSPTPATIGKLASTHGRPCSCFLCKHGPGKPLIPLRRLIADYLT